MMNALFTTATLVLEGVVAGVFVGSQMTEHAVRHLGAGDWITFNRAKDAVYGPVMPAMFGAALAASVVAAFAVRHPLAQASAAALLLAAGIITARVHLPLNRAFAGWSPAAHPADWDGKRRRWRRWNAARTALAVLGFGLTAATCVVDGRGIA